MNYLNTVVYSLFASVLLFILYSNIPSHSKTINYECSQGCPEVSLQERKFKGMVECVYADSRLNMTLVTIKSEPFYLCKIEYENGEISAYTLLHTEDPIRVTY